MKEGNTEGRPVERLGIKKAVCGVGQLKEGDEFGELRCCRIDAQPLFFWRRRVEYR